MTKHMYSGPELTTKDILRRRRTEMVIKGFTLTLALIGTVLAAIMFAQHLTCRSGCTWTTLIQ